MTATGHRGGMGWGARLLIAFSLVLVGAAAATWGLARSERAARFLGVHGGGSARAGLNAREPQQRRPVSPTLRVTGPADLAVSEPAEQRIAELERRLSRVESATAQAAGSAGRADSLLIAAAARRAIDRGVALGYLEPLLLDRFGNNHRRAVATIVSGGRRPVRLGDLVTRFESLGPELRRGSSEDGWWTGFKRELGSIVQIHSVDRPSLAPDARYDRALRRLQAGDVDQALVETMRMPGAGGAEEWIADARRYIAIRRALDELETAALMPGRLA